MSYLGKISAIVSANTSDFSAKLAASGKEVASWARSLNTAVNSASSKASSSLRGIYTEAQKAERALLAIQAKKISFKGFEGKDLESAVDRMRSLISVTKGVNEPLNQAARALEKMPLAMQGGFIEAMKTAQKQAEMLAIDIDRIGKGSALTDSGLERKFGAIASRAMRTAEAVERLKAAAGGVGGLATGKELQFRNPEFVAEMARARGVQAQAAATPGGNFAGIVERQRAAADATAAAFARMEEAQLTIGGDVAGTTSAYQSQLSVLKAIGNELESAVAETNAKANASQKAADAEIAVLKYRAQAEREAEDRRFAAAQKTLDQEIAVLKYRAQAEAELERKRAAAEQKAADAEIAVLKYRAQAEAELERKRAAAEQKSFDNEVALLIRREQAAKAAEQQKDAAPGAATKLGPRFFSSAIGRDIESTRTLIKNLGDTPLAGTLGPQLDTLKNKFGILTREAKLTADQVKQVNSISREAGAIRSAVSSRKEMTKEFLGDNGGMGKAGLDLGADKKALSGAAAEIDLVQRKMSLLSREARGPVVDALENFRRANARAFKDGSIATDEGKAKLEKYRVALVNALAAATKTSPAKLAEELKKIGDVGRFGADKAGLAFQQLGFAIDDFMSSTGGVDQKIRAVSNNISQMAYIIGSTKGLFVALGVTMASQVAVMIYKFANGGKTAEDQTKALNDALARQKSLLEELSQAFRSFGDSLTRGIFSKSSEELRGFTKEIDDILKKRRDLDRAGLVDIDPTVQRERETQAVLQKRLEGETDIGKRLVLQGQIQQSKEKEKAAAEAAVNAPLPTAADAAKAIDNAATKYFQRITSGEESITARDAQILVRGQQAAREAAAAGGPKQLLEVLTRERDVAAKNSVAFPEDAAMAAAVRELEELIKRLSRSFKEADNEVVRQILEGGVAVNRSLSAVQELLDETVAPFSQTRAEAEKVGDRIKEIITELEKGATPEREAKLRDEMAALERQSAAYRSAAEVIRTFADTVKRISTALSDAVAEEARSAADKARRDDIEARAALKVNGEFGPDGERRREGDAQRAADRARDRRLALEQNAAATQGEADDVRNEALAARQKFEEQMAGDPQIQAERQERERARAVIDSKDATEAQRAAASKTIAGLDKQGTERWEQSPLGQKFVEKADRVAIAKAEIEESLRQEEESARAARRGADLGLAPGALESRKAADGIRDIAAAMEKAAPGLVGIQGNGPNVDGLITAQQAQEQASRFAQDQMRSAAPAIFEMADAVQNAILQGPSRQALEVSDVSTMEGSRELNRLLRGDDASKNANLVELQKQNQTMTEVRDTLKDVAQKMGIVLDL